MKKDSTIIVSQSDSRIPTIADSEKIIKEKAPAALRTLAERNALDLAEMLGLTPHMRIGF